MTARGKFITLEGMDGAGKSSHLQFLEAKLRSRAEVLVTREPGGTELAERLRELALGQPMDPVAETLLMFAARSDHVRKVIVPALKEGTWVLCDRFTDATLAYQGGGKNVSQQLIQSLVEAVHSDLQPDRTFVFDCTYEVARERLGNSGRALDRFEAEGAAFFQRVRAAYLDLARTDPGRVVLVDAAVTPQAVQKQLETALGDL